MDQEFLIGKLLESAPGQVQEVLKMGSRHTEEIRELQTLLYELGYGKKLHWKARKANGVYDAAVKNTVRLFSKNNKLKHDGKCVTADVLKRMLGFHNVLPDLQQLYSDHRAGLTRKKYCKGSTDKLAVASLQKVLYALGYGEAMQWDKYQNDGIYGNLTAQAVKLFAEHRDMKSDGKVITQKMIRKLIKELSPFFGKDWPRTRATVQLGEVKKADGLSDEAKPAPPAEAVRNSPLVVYTNTHFTGDKLIAHLDFLPVLEKLNEYARRAGVILSVTSSFRTGYHVNGAIVPPARMSNHMVGHAVDVNIRYGEAHARVCNNQCLGSRQLPPPVASFIQALQADPGIRWGGTFKPPDPVHIDDHFNKDPEAWRRKYDAVQMAREQGLA
jgi:peptidoglycan hydrolase-like protein with peptidoglycan-binding domain